MDIIMTRRELLKAMSAAGLGFALTGCAGPALKKIMEEELARESNTPVIWLQGQGCTGCSVSLLNSVNPDIAEILTETINLEFHPTVMASAGESSLQMCERAIADQKGKFVLVVEGSLPLGADEHFCDVGEKDGKPISSAQLAKRLGSAASAVLAVGACASFGGIPAGKPNPTQAKSVSQILPNATVINIPGCPAHPDWIVGTIAHVLLFGLPELDEHKRPKAFFGKLVHENCERRAYFEDKKFAKDYSDEGCLFELGCKGPEAFCDAPLRSWNNKTNWCCRSGGPCIGCTQPTFPDHEGSGLYGCLPLSKTEGIPWAKREEFAKTRS
jgi:hydrogenase small subunit